MSLFDAVQAYALQAGEKRPLPRFLPWSEDDITGLADGVVRVKNTGGHALVVTHIRGEGEVNAVGGSVGLSVDSYRYTRGRVAASALLGRKRTGDYSNQAYDVDTGAELPAPVYIPPNSYLELDLKRPSGVFASAGRVGYLFGLAVAPGVAKAMAASPIGKLYGFTLEAEVTAADPSKRPRHNINARRVLLERMVFESPTVAALESAQVLIANERLFPDALWDGRSEGLPGPYLDDPATRLGAVMVSGEAVEMHARRDSADAELRATFLGREF